MNFSIFIEWNTFQREYTERIYLVYILMEYAISYWAYESSFFNLC